MWLKLVINYRLKHNLSFTLLCTPTLVTARNRSPDYAHTLAVGDTLTWSCPPNFVFLHDFYAIPEAVLACANDGTADPDEWPECVDRE